MEMMVPWSTRFLSLQCHAQKTLTKSYKYDVSQNVARIPSAVSMQVLEETDLDFRNCSSYWLDTQTLIKYVRIDKTRIDARMNPSTWKWRLKGQKLKASFCSMWPLRVVQLS